MFPSRNASLQEYHGLLAEKTLHENELGDLSVRTRDSGSELEYYQNALRDAVDLSELLARVEQQLPGCAGRQRRKRHSRAHLPTALFPDSHQKLTEEVRDLGEKLDGHEQVIPRTHAYLII